MQDIVLTCTGGAAGQQLPVYISLSLNTSITSRTLGAGTQSEAQLLIYDAGGNISHLVSGVPSGNGLLWNNVGLTAPGPNGQLTLRITNIRADVTGIPTDASVQAHLSVLPGGLAPIISRFSVGYIAPDMRFQVRDCAGVVNLDAGGAVVGCAGANNTGGTSNLIAGNVGTMQYSLAFDEGISTGFRRQVEPAQISAPPGIVYNTESGFIPSPTYDRGLASQGVRLHARFTNLPAGVRLFVTNRESAGTSGGSMAVLVQLNGTYVAEPLAPRVPTPLPATHTLYCPTAPLMGYGAVEVPITNGSAEAVWEVTESSRFLADLFVFGVAIAHSGIPAPDEVSVEGFVGPVFPEVTPSIAQPPVPRFRLPLANRQKSGAFAAVSISPKVLPAGQTTLVTIRVEGTCIDSVTSIGVQPGLSAGPVTSLSGTTWRVPITVAANTTLGDTPVAVIGRNGASRVNLTVGPQVFTISGRVTRQGVGFSGVDIGLIGGSGIKRTDAAGNYSFTDVLSGTYTVVPFLNGYSFEPQRITLTNLQADATVNFTATFNSTIAPTAATVASPLNGSVNDLTIYDLSWYPGNGVESYDVYFGVNPTPPFLMNVSGTYARIPKLALGTTYFWRVVAKNPHGSTSSPTWFFQTIATPIGLGFHILPPCRVIDSRGLTTTGMVGLPLAAYAPYGISPPGSNCGLPPSVRAYSLNMTAIPAGRLDYLSTWPAGDDFPNVSTLNSPAGLIMANAAIVPAGLYGAINLMASNPSEYVVDVNGYFNYGTEGVGLLYFPVPPCRAVDTRASQGKSGTFGPPALTAFVNRDFPIVSSDCNLPAGAQAFAMNLTVIPHGRLDYVSMWPSGQPYPGVSTLNAPDASTIANAAIVPAGAGGAVTVFGSANTDLIMDVNGFFAPHGTAPDGLQFYPITPCRAVDTRAGHGKTGAFGPPALAANISRDIPIRQSCNLPTTARAYSLNLTAVPHAALPYLSVWPTGQPFPNVSTLNSPHGRNIANAAIIPAGTNGSIRVMAAGPTDLIVDINGYFAP